MREDLIKLGGFLHRLFTSEALRIQPQLDLSYLNRSHVCKDYCRPSQCGEGQGEFPQCWERRNDLHRTTDFQRKGKESVKADPHLDTDPYLQTSVGSARERTPFGQHPEQGSLRSI